MPMVTRTLRQAQPKNRGVERIARSSLDNLMPLIQEQQNNAMAVNAYPVIFYSKKNTGIKCTCSIVDPSTATNPDGTPNTGTLPSEPGVHVLNPDGSGTDAYISSMLNGAAISIDRYGSRNKEQNNPQRSLPHSPLYQSDDVINKSGSLNDPFADQVEPFDTKNLFDDDSLATLNENLLTGNAVEGCAVCMGTGFVGGYDPVNGLRIVLDAQAEEVMVNNFSISSEKHPNTFQVLADGIPSGGEQSVQYKITLPIGVIGVDCIRLWNNGTQITNGFRFEILVNSEWVEADEQTILSQCDGLDHSLRMVLIEGSTIDEFTHLELQLDTGSNPLYVEWPRQSASQVLTLPDEENLDPVQVIISPYVPSVHIKDVIAEMKNGRPWLITTVTDFKDRELSVNGWDVSARLIQKTEWVYNLFVRRLPHLGTKFATHNRLQNKGDAGYNPNNPNHFNRNR